MIKKELTVKTLTLDPNFFTYAADYLELCHRKAGKIGIVSYPVYETMNKYWYVIHENGQGAVYHESELTEYVYTQSV